MEWLSDLVWVGSTLYPRWFVLAVLASPAVLVAVLAAAVEYWTK